MKIMTVGTGVCGEKNNQIFLRISALASKKRSNQKNKCTFIFLEINKNKSINSFFWFGLFVEARAESLKNFCLYFGPNDDTKVILKLTDL